MKLRDINFNNYEEKMKDLILLELDDRWEREAKTPEIQNNSEESKLVNVEERGRRQGKRECVVALRALVNLLGEDNG